MLDWTANGQSTKNAEIHNSKSQRSVAESLTHSKWQALLTASISTSHGGAALLPTLLLLPSSKPGTNTGTRGTAVPRGDPSVAAPLGGSQQQCSLAKRMPRVFMSLGSAGPNCPKGFLHLLPAGVTGGDPVQG